MPTRARTCSSLPLVLMLALAATSLASAQGIEKPRVPVRTAVHEINVLRAAYEDAFNKKDVPALTAMYAPDAIVIQGDGSVQMGRKAIGEAMTQQSARWPKTTFSADTMRVYGNTAWVVGTGADSSGTTHYLVVLRRGIQDWTISSSAVVRERGAASGE